MCEALKKNEWNFKTENFPFKKFPFIKEIQTINKLLNSR
jgi:hypothetical protein